ncbi:phage scaffolding protein [Macrococcus psychrotolerans]|uniref:Phage scaffolding protein n=1 Tax=Macrococcus psychrotolerans TaxID=3039389 RepID=A0AAT9P455_9STAP|nr:MULTISPECIES: phage scaffolding protein [Macrococcus]QYA31985.1 phage scaffolding protein [Macrococcus sp. 19Msa1099]QYA36791.1 phage scaffolding protein [Macrococcus caseolyticus]QYA75499.1 phage scaffolding protein [Macrococcus caseolyticus]
MERKDLTELGIEAEAVDKIMEMYGKDVNPIKQENESLKAEVKSFKEQVADRDNQLDEIKTKVGDAEALNATIDSLKQANKDKDEAHQNLVNQVKLDYEIKLALNEAGAKNERAVKALIDLDTVKINEDGQLIGLNEQLTNLKSTDDYLFNCPINPKDKDINNDPEKPPNNLNPGGQQGNGGKDPDLSEVGKAHAKRLFNKD